MKLFVYGTLKRGYWNHRSYLGDAEFIGEGQTKKEYAMAGRGVPYLIRSRTYAAPIRGEVFEFDPSGGALKRLDRLEGAYDRVRGVIQMDNGKRITAYYYVGRCGYGPDHEGELQRGFDRHRSGSALRWPSEEMTMSMTPRRLVSGGSV